MRRQNDDYPPRKTSLNMPAERSESRRTSRRLSAEEETELRRARGEISCAECRRLKLKCDKKVPCSSCVRRGCTTICPNGSLSAGQGTRFILADTEQLHRKISEMSERIRQLEDALALMQSGLSENKHPLLRDELLAIKFGPELRRTVDEEHTRENLSQSIDALGTLTIGDHGETKYIGRAGGPETLFLVNNANPVEAEMEALPSLPPELANLSLSFPFTMIDDGIDIIIDKLESCLPPHPRASALCEAYLAHYTVYSRPIKRDELINDILSPIYNSLKSPFRSRTSHHPSISDTGRCPHLLAVLFLVLAAGALVDLTLPPCSTEAETYYRLGRAALSLRSIFDSPEIETIQAVTLMGGYHSLCAPRYSIESAWALVSLASKLAQSIGLHRDSKQWKLDEKSVQRRRNLFWEIFILDVLHCLALGRPPTYQLAYIDCEIASDDEETIDKDGQKLQGYWYFRTTLIRDIFIQMAEVILRAKPPSYATILDLDRKLRQMELPPVNLGSADDDYSDRALCVKRYLVSHYRGITMLTIHRTFFAQALLENPTNPLASPYAPSFLAANRCASLMLKSFIKHHEHCGELCGRFWNMWTHAFSAAVVVGSTVARMPHSIVAPSALIELDLAVKVFERGSVKSLRARQALPLLHRLQERATYVYDQYREKRVLPSGSCPRSGPEDHYQDALAIFGGQTRVLPSKSISRRRPRGSRESSRDASAEASPRAAANSPPTPAPAQQSADSLTEIHPSVMEYLSRIPPSSYSSIPVAELEAPSSASLPMQSHIPAFYPPLTSIPETVPQSEVEFLNGLLIDPQFHEPLSTFVPDFNGQMTTDVFNRSSYSEDTMMNDQWMSLMQETGILDDSTNMPQVNGPNPETFFTTQLM
ncbi:hypothetical protein AcV7_004081 [Taiwanofungus camphoratus]|nr:hypothetical protein AcV7_004081 [Antrodia cinnamomea]